MVHTDMVKMFTHTIKKVSPYSSLDICIQLISNSESVDFAKKIFSHFQQEKNYKISIIVRYFMHSWLESLFFSKTLVSGNRKNSEEKIEIIEIIGMEKIYSNRFFRFYLQSYSFVYKYIKCKIPNFFLVKRFLIVFAILKEVCNSTCNIR